MPAPEKTNPEQLEKYAFHLFSARSAANQRRGTEALAIEAYRDAEAFIAVTNRVRSGEQSTAKPTGAILSEVSAPNLKPTHPHNLVSQRFGNLKRVRDIADKLEKNPNLDTFDELDWGPQEVKLARIIFPAYAEKNAQLASN